MADSKRYSEREVAEILRLASEHQPLATTEGLSLEEIKTVAGELGLDIAAIESASRVVDRGGSAKNSETQFECLRSFNGELTDDGWEEVIAKMRQRTGLQGTVTERGATREWTGNGELRTTFLTVTTRDGVSRFRLYTEASGFVALAWVIAFVPLFLGGIMTGAFIKKGAPLAIVGPIYAVVALVTIFMAMRAIRNRKRESQEFNGLLDEFEPFIQPAATVLESRRVESEESVSVQSLSVN
ncbi:MAG: hypothetical protein ABL949_01775 [Fimbriimonadaceae bacterium]